MRSARPPGAPRLLAVLVAALLGGALPAQAQEAVDGARDAEHPLPLEALGTLSPALVGVELEGRRWEAASTRWQRAVAGLEDAAGAVEEAERLLAGLGPRRDLLAAERAAAGRRRFRAEGRSEAAERRLVTVAVAEFMGPTDPGEATVPRALGDADARLRRAVLSRAVDEASRAGLQAAGERLAAAVADEDRLVAALADVERRLAEATRSSAEAAAAIRTWTEERDEQLAALTRLAPRAAVAGTDLSAVALDAYLRASRRAGRRDCPVPWTVLAGIGRVESGHGTYRGAEPDERGDVRPAIVGIPLDGTRRTRAITDSDSGLLDGDVLVDRAVGPLQFIPTTWATSGVDANGDGVADPQNLYDAAASAAGYLCRASGGRPVAEVLDAAVFSYNHDRSYVDRVLGFAGRYAELDLLPADDAAATGTERAQPDPSSSARLPA